MGRVIDHSSMILSAEVVLACDDIGAALAFFTQKLGFHLSSIAPADNPEVAVIKGYGLRIRLACNATGSAGVLRLLCHNPKALLGADTHLMAPNGTRVELVEAGLPLFLPPLKSSFVLTRYSELANWSVGRAGMCYRDLIPDRQGGRFVASHIRIANGGPVPDYEHFHKVRFQMIYCLKGWVRVVYEDQGPPFDLQAGDCVLQPTEIRHRVLECSPGLEVIEIGCPAEHETHVDEDLKLPTTKLCQDRVFSGQRFVRHIAANADWNPWWMAGFECRNTRIDEATNGLASVQVVRAAGPEVALIYRHESEFMFLFVLCGGISFLGKGIGTHKMSAGDALVIPAHLDYALTAYSQDLQLLEVRLPARIRSTPCNNFD